MMYRLIKRFNILDYRSIDTVLTATWITSYSVLLTGSHQIYLIYKKQNKNTSSLGCFLKKNYLQLIIKMEQFCGSQLETESWRHALAVVEDSQWISGLWLIVIVYHGFAVVKMATKSQDQILQTIDTKIRGTTSHQWNLLACHQWIPLAKASDAVFYILFDITLINHLNRQLSGQWFEMSQSSCNITVMWNCVMNEKTCGFLYITLMATQKHIHTPYCNLWIHI